MNRWTISFKDAATGLGIAGLVVELCNSAGAKMADFTDKGNGSYYVDLATSGNYRVKCNGNYVDIYEYVHKTANDIIIQSNVDNATLEFVDIGGGVYKLRIKDGGVTAAKLNSDVAGDGMKQNVGGSLSPDVDNTTIELDPTTKKIQIKSGVFVAGTVVGDRKYTENNIIADEESITASLEKIDKAFGALESLKNNSLFSYYWWQKYSQDGSKMDVTEYLDFLAQQVLIASKKVASHNVRNAHDDEISTHRGTYTKLKTITFSRGLLGQARFAWQMRIDSTGMGYSKLYKNGSPISGTEDGSGSTSYSLKCVDLTLDFAPGDTIELWAYTTDSPVYVKEFRVCYDNIVAVESVNK